LGPVHLGRDHVVAAMVGPICPHRGHDRRDLDVGRGGPPDWVQTLVGVVGLGQDAQMDYETALLRLPPHVDRVTAAVQLTIAAEFSGWELARVQLFRDGTRKVLLRRRRSVPALPALSY
jgi:hypothetical protein